MAWILPTWAQVAVPLIMLFHLHLVFLLMLQMFLLLLQRPCCSGPMRTCIQAYQPRNSRVPSPHQRLSRALHAEACRKTCLLRLLFRRCNCRNNLRCLCGPYMYV